MSADRRRWQRFKVPAKILVSPKKGEPFEARIQDLSAGGAFVLSDHPMAAREAIRLTFYPGGALSEIEVDGEAVNNLGPGFGVEFAGSTSEATRNAILEWIDELAKAPVSKPAQRPLTPPRGSPGLPKPSGPAPSPAAPAPPRSAIARIAPVAVPAAPPPAPAPAPEAAAPPAPPVTAAQPAPSDRPRPPGGDMGAPRILLVQDNRELAKMLINILEKVGAQVVGVHESKRVDDMLRRGHYDVVLIDWLPSDQPAETLVKMIRERSPKVPIVVVTALAHNEAFRNKARAVGATDFVKKPFQLKELIETLDLAIDTKAR